ncbi:hypothetical protein [Actinomadura sp. HBU206391]|nr:hypothetical protein [Actinomadura sp. HBU206391]MBC6461552.1 hypothetical protein [Actinomadura sp. HBU206391]
MTILSLASMSTGFVLGWVVGRPRRWYSGVWADAAPRDDLPPLPRVSTGA